LIRGIAMSTDDPPRWPRGLDDVRAGLDDLFRNNPYLAQVGAELADWGPGWAQIKALPSSQALNIAGTVHGGLIASLADLAFEVACNSYGRKCVAVQFDAHFASAARAGIPLVAECRETSRATRIASYRIEVREESSDSPPMALCTAIAYRTSGWHLGEDRYPSDWKQRH
jgi:acyl-CoA thioesterase